MRRILGVFAALMLCAGTAHAGVFDKVKDWITGEAVGAIIGLAALAGNALLGYLHNKNAARFNKIATTTAETGEFLMALGNNVKDGKLSREELSEIIKEGADVVNVAKPTPAKFTLRELQ